MPDTVKFITTMQDTIMLTLEDSGIGLTSIEEELLIGLEEEMVEKLTTTTVLPLPNKRKDGYITITE